MEGIGEAVKLTIKLIPYLCAVFMAIRLMQISGLSIILANFINPLFMYLGIPKELIELLVIRPLSGSGSIAILENVYSLYGA
ncbi:MAG: spore maturation protein, partial [Clostridia bacterium]|nr:spore maturation protein [Clostridia bacterium]